MAKKLPQAAPASVPSDELIREAHIQEATYRCSIRDNPALDLPAADADEARQKYMLILGITATENTITAVALT